MPVGGTGSVWYRLPGGVEHRCGCLLENALKDAVMFPGSKHSSTAAM